MKKRIAIITISLFICTQAISQYYYGVKGGIGLNMQKWNDYERDILFSPCIDIFSETNDDPINKLYASLGFHTRGSAVRGFGITTFNSYKFNNISFEVGGKRMVSHDKKYNGYYLVGLRGEYTVSTNLDSRPTSVYNLVSDVYVNKFNYGVSVGGGFEYTFTDTRVLFLEVVVSPDLSKQYNQRETLTIENPNPNPFNTSQFVTIRPQEVRNVSLEIKLGIKFLQGYDFEE